MDKYYYCDKCDGRSQSTGCENPSCPDQPCCGKPKKECRCHDVYKEAARIMEDNMSAATSEHVKKMPELKHWIIDSMMEYSQHQRFQMLMKTYEIEKRLEEEGWWSDKISEEEYCKKAVKEIINIIREM